MQRVITRDPFAPTSARRSGFWIRQFSEVPTEKQDRFDVVFGIVLPVICLVVDPIVFQGGFFGERAWLGKFQLFAYLFCGLQIGIFLCWRTLAQHLAPAAGLIGGVLLAGALFSFIVGVLILPITLLGLVILIGVVGFTPFLTSFVYLRTGVRALKRQQTNALFRSRFLLGVATALLSVAMPALVSHEVSKTISRSINQIVYGNPKEAQAAVGRLKWMHVSATALTQLVDAYRNETHSEKRAVLKAYYKELTGEEIEGNFSYD
jgi:hypothetical protein